MDVHCLLWLFSLAPEEGDQGLRAEMSCGHAVTPESLTGWCRSLLDQVGLTGSADRTDPNYIFLKC